MQWGFIAHQESVFCMSDPLVDTQKLLHLAVENFQNGRLQEAKTYFHEALAKAPDDFDALHLSGVLELQLGQLDRAEELIAKALTINPNFADAHYNLAKVFEGQGRWQEAMGSYQKAVSLEPGLDVAHFNLGLIHARLGDFENAIASYQQAIQTNPGDWDYHFNLGNAFNSVNNLEAAILSYRIALDLDPSKPEANNNLGIAYKELGSLEQAIVSFQQALKIYPDYADAHYNLANTYEEVGRMNDALVSYQKAIAVKPDLAKAHNNLGNIYYALGKKEKAAELYQRAVELDPASFSSRHMLNSIRGTPTETTPIQYVESLFDKAAGSFENQLVDKLKYNAPNDLKTHLIQLAGKNYRFRRAVDLGCGTGLSGQAFRPLSDRLAGVDISSKMVAEAKRKEIYDALSVGEILNFLNQSSETYDLFLATDVMVYFGNLAAFFSTVKSRAMQGSYFLFSTEGCEGENYSLRQTGRFAHSKDYIQNLAEEFQFVVASCQPTTIRMENDQPISGFNFILRSS